MKSAFLAPSRFCLRLALATAALAFSFGLTPAYAANDPAAELLARRGIVHVESVGPYVKRGTFLIQVAVKLGPPTAKVGRDLWLYERRQIDGSGAAGTLVIRFVDDCVVDLAIATPQVVATLRHDARPELGSALAAK